MFLDLDEEFKKIEWTYDFLKDYQTEDIDERIVINTIKNTLKTYTAEEICQFEQNRVKKEKRIQWFDKVARSTSNAKIGMQFPRGSTPIKKNPKQFFAKALAKK